MELKVTVPGVRAPSPYILESITWSWKLSPFSEHCRTQGGWIHYMELKGASLVGIFISRTRIHYMELKVQHFVELPPQRPQLLNPLHGVESGQLRHPRGLHMGDWIHYMELKETWGAYSCRPLKNPLRIHYMELKVVSNTGEGITTIRGRIHYMELKGHFPQHIFKHLQQDWIHYMELKDYKPDLRARSLKRHWIHYMELKVLWW